MALVAYAILFGLFDGCYVGQISTILGDLMQDKSKIGVALGNLYALFSIPVMSGPIIAGAIYDSSQSFDIPFYAAMGVSLLGAFITSFIRVFDKSRVDQVEGGADETLITLTKPNMEKRELLFPGDSHKMMEIIDSKLTVV
jgi:MFS family permease